MENIEWNQQCNDALERMEKSRKNIFLTGRAGTGKSTLLRYFRTHTNKKVVVLAPTGVAAVNIKGQTIHSFFKFKPDIILSKIKRKSLGPDSIYRQVETIVIDEISMVRADLLDCIDVFLRLNRRNTRTPFGGVQMIFIGDLYQLPPVVTREEKEIFREHYQTPYFFSARVFEAMQLEYIELEKIYRQRDDEFIKILNAIRNKTITNQQLRDINEKCFLENINEEFKNFTIRLTTTNAIAETVNQKKLNELVGEKYVFAGKIDGKFDQKSLPTDANLILKKDAQVMLVNNDTAKRWINGTMGKVAHVYQENGEKIIQVKLQNGRIENVKRNTWELFQYTYDAKKGALDSKIVGSFEQYPLLLAWAVTIHKSQGKTFDRVILDIGTGTFAHGQMYVALSRCTSLDGIILKQRLEQRHIILDERVMNFVTGYQYLRAEKNMPMLEKKRLLERALRAGKKVEITYLRQSDEKSLRDITPLSVGEMEYQGVKFLGCVAKCHLSREEKIFRVDRILAVRNI